MSLDGSTAPVPSCYNAQERMEEFPAFLTPTAVILFQSLTSHEVCQPIFGAVANPVYQLKDAFLDF